MERRIEPKRIALVLTVFASDLLLTGLVFGWAPLLLMLQDEQQYGELCTDDAALIDSDDTSNTGFACVEQENQLNLMFAVASVTMNAASLPIGIFLDYAGPMKAITLAAIVELTGLFLMAYADSQTFDVFLPAYTMLAFGGSMTMMASFPASFVIMQYQTAILAGISCFFDGSSVVFLILYTLQSAFDTTRQQLFIGLAMLAGVIYLLLIVFWYLNEGSINLNSDTSDSASVTEEDLQETNALLNPETHVEAPNADYGATLHDPFMDDTTIQKLQLELDALQLVDVPMRKQLMSIEFAFIVVFAMIQVLRATFYIGTTNKLLENYGDGDDGYIYTKVFSIILPLGFLFVPAIDYIVEDKGLALSLLVTNGLGVAYNVLSLVPNLPVQCFAFFLFTGFRAFLYAVMSAFTAKTFGLKNLGTLMGIIFSIGSVVSLLEYPAVLISNEYLEGDLTVVYSVSLFLCIALIPFTSYLRKHEHAKEQRQRELLVLLGPFASSESKPQSMLGVTADVPDLLNTPSHGLAYLRSPYRSPRVKKTAKP